jgi:hypothetical protein
MKRSPISIKEYKQGNFTPCINDLKFRPVIRKYGDFPGILKRAFSNHRVIFLDQFGKQDFVFTGEYKHYCWGFTLPSGLRLVVLTGNQGTGYEYELGSKITKEDVADLDHFLDGLK